MFATHVLRGVYRPKRRATRVPIIDVAWSGNTLLKEKFNARRSVLKGENFQHGRPILR